MWPYLILFIPWFCLLKNHVASLNKNKIRLEIKWYRYLLNETPITDEIFYA